MYKITRNDIFKLLESNNSEPVVINNFFDNNFAEDLYDYLEKLKFKRINKEY
jgi:hypothetical protein